MRVLGIDPGATTGWCLYTDTDGGRFAQAQGMFREAEMTPEFAIARRNADVVVLERPVAHGPTRPQVVDCAWFAGKIAAMTGAITMTRLEIRQTLTAATHGVVTVRNDATAWAAVVLLHGDGSDRKPKRRKGVVVEAGGPLGEVTAHARAALAVAVAFVLREWAKA